MDYKKLLSKMNSNSWYDYMDDAIQALCEYDSEHGGLDIVSCDIVEEIAKHELEQGGLMRLKCFLASAELGDDYFYLDGYGNLQNITKNWVVMQLEDIVDNGE